MYKFVCEGEGEGDGKRVEVLTDEVQIDLILEDIRLFLMSTGFEWLTEGSLELVKNDELVISGDEHAKDVDKIDILQEEVDKLRTMCKAAARELETQWTAHCDSDGTGPVNLLMRLKGELAPDYYLGYLPEDHPAQYI